MLALLAQHPDGIVVKPNEGTSGDCVFKVRTESGLELAAHRIFARIRSGDLAYLEIENEVRVVLIDHRPLAVYRKARPGHGRRRAFAAGIALAATPAGLRSAVCRRCSVSSTARRWMRLCPRDSGVC